MVVLLSFSSLIFSSGVFFFINPPQDAGAYTPTGIQPLRLQSSKSLLHVNFEQIFQPGRLIIRLKCVESRSNHAEEQKKKK
jgi:hypothetical protein